MRVRVSEYDIGRIQVGQAVSIQADVLGKERAAGVVTHISPTGEKKSESENEMVIPVDIDITEGKGIIAGVTGRAEILIARSENTLAVPIDAVFEDPATGKKTVFILKDDNTLGAVPVEIGVESSLFVEVFSDALQDGDKVVLSPGFDLSDGLAAYEKNPAVGQAQAAQ
jgi:multidrug efflux pump subunit AcrA (membrane-fusion protein)